MKYLTITYWVSNLIVGTVGGTRQKWDLFPGLKDLTFHPGMLM